MNSKKIAQMLGFVLLFMAGFMLLPAVVALIYREYFNISAFLIPVGCLLVLGLFLIRFKTTETRFFAKDGFATVGFSWILISLFGCIPFLIHGFSFADAFFEAVSGFTTTGATVISDVESLPMCLLFWRSLTHWIGGMGILVFTLAIIPKTGISSIYLMAAESTGPTAEKVSPKIRDCAKIAYEMYLSFTVLEIILLKIGGMPFFDAIVYTFGTVSTGGFGLKNAGLIGTISPYSEVVISCFMFLCGINFQIFYMLLIKRAFKSLKNTELRTYILIVVGVTVAIVFNIYPLYRSFATSLRYAFFQVASIVTTTGFSTADYESWPMLSQTLLFVLMFIGGCAGSTAGGFKVIRILILMKNGKRELNRVVAPRAVSTIRMDGNKTMEEQVVSKTVSYFSLYIGVLALSLLLLSLDKTDLLTNIGGVTSALNNIGPAFGSVGPTDNFSLFSHFSKYVLSVDMLMGRLELYPILLLFLPKTWKKQ